MTHSKYRAKHHNSLKGFVKSNICRIRNLNKTKYTCPICNYRGPFADFVVPDTWSVRHARCPNCDSFARHRLAQLAIAELQKSYNFSAMKMLHFAPEDCFRQFFPQICQGYITADLNLEGVDVKANLTQLPFKNAEFDLVFASHVLEHIREDLQALSEIRRVLKPGGIAILPVPIVGITTVEYPEPNLFEAGHVRAPGLDYYQRYSDYFCEIKYYSSEDFVEKFQTFVYEDRSIYPTKKCPWRQPMTGKKHIDTIPVCLV